MMKEQQRSHHHHHLTHRIAFVIIFISFIQSITNHHHHYTVLAQEEDTTTTSSSSSSISYGVDISYPIHHHTVSTNYAWLPHNIDPINNPTIPPEYEGMPIQPLGNKQQFYNDFIAGCKEFYGKEKGYRCNDYDNERIEDGLHQPQSVVNYTNTGYKKIKAPPEIWNLIQTFWNQNNQTQTMEYHAIGNTFMNHWDVPTYMVDVSDEDLIGGGSYLKELLWDAAVDTIREWMTDGNDDDNNQQLRLKTSSLYGIRVYKEGAILAPHVDRFPLINSAIINVDQDVDEDWPLEIYGRDGMARNITMKPGDMILYESHSLLHGRPFPLKGRFYANVFIHFEPDEEYGERPSYMTPDGAEYLAEWWREEVRAKEEEDYEDEEEDFYDDEEEDYEEEDYEDKEEDEDEEEEEEDDEEDYEEMEDEEEEDEEEEEEYNEEEEEYNEDEDEDEYNEDEYDEEDEDEDEYDEEDEDEYDEDEEEEDEEEEDEDEDNETTNDPDFSFKETNNKNLEL